MIKQFVLDHQLNAMRLNGAKVGAERSGDRTINVTVTGCTSYPLIEPLYWTSPFSRASFNGVCASRRSRTVSVKTCALLGVANGARAWKSSTLMVLALPG